MPVLTFLKSKEIKKIFDKDSIIVIEYLLKKLLFSQPELLPKQKQDYIQIPKEYLEQWVSQGLDWEPIASGNYPIDVYSKKLKIGADVKFISAKVDKDNLFTAGESNETSLGQNFKDTGEDLDRYFQEKNYKKILKGWQTILNKKINEPIIKYGLNKIYYFIFVRGGNSINLSIAKLNKNQLKSIKVSKTTGKSTFIENFINDKYGNVKIYKSKKRMELRCRPKNMEADNLFIKWNFEDLLRADGIKLRKLIKNKVKFNNHIKKEINRFFNLG